MFKRDHEKVSPIIVLFSIQIRLHFFFLQAKYNFLVLSFDFVCEI